MQSKADSPPLPRYPPGRHTVGGPRNQRSGSRSFIALDNRTYIPFDGLNGPQNDGVDSRPQEHLQPGTGVPQGTYRLVAGTVKSRHGRVTGHASTPV